ncbi:MAG: DUF2231 domain-containing protein [Sulfobacillus sp.]|nr:DUF2231 domain-containing protein [Sulfobacillus sp.]
MGFLFHLWGAVLGLWIQIGTRIFPPTIHPMVVHFPIVLLYLSLLTAILSWLWPTPDRFFDRASFWLLVLGLLAGIVAAAMGVVSEHFVRWTATTDALLSAHQRDAVLTGFFGLASLALRLLARYPRASGQGWSLAHTQRGRQTLLSFVFLIGAVALVTLTASIGGTMVYQYGVGVH